MSDVALNFQVDLFSASNDGSAAERVLRGDPIVVIPKVTFTRGGEVRSIDDQVVAEFVDNYEHRLERGIRRSRVAVDVDHDGKAVGWYRDVMVLPGGVGATFQFTKRGREALESGEYAYFSPTVYWNMQDGITGKPVRNQIAGGAITNYPFFGEETALFATLAADAPVWFAVTKTEEGEQYPARAYLVVEDPESPSTWHLRVMSWQDGTLAYDHNLMGAANAALTSPGGHRGNRYQGPQHDEAVSKLQKIYEQEGLEFNSIGGVGMSGEGEHDSEDMVRTLFSGLLSLGRKRGESEQGGAAAPAGGEDLSAPPAENHSAEIAKLAGDLKALQDAFSALQAERDGLKSSLDSVVTARASEQMTALVAQKFSHIPGKSGDLAEQLQWLKGTDEARFAFFAGILETADAALAQSFRDVPVSVGGDAGAAINSLVSAYMAEHQGVEYSDALGAVVREHPELYAQYTKAV